MDILTHPFMGMVILSPLSSPLDLGLCTTTPPMLANHHTSIHPCQGTMALHILFHLSTALHHLQLLGTLINGPLMWLTDNRYPIMVILLVLMTKKFGQIGMAHPVHIWRTTYDLHHHLPLSSLNRWKRNLLQESKVTKIELNEDHRIQKKSNPEGNSQRRFQ